MFIHKTIAIIGAVAAISFGAAEFASAHGAGEGDAHQPCGGHQGWQMGPGMMGYGMMNPYMMNPYMMNPYMMNPYMMGPGMMGPGMMGPGMMGQGTMGQGMMGSGMMDGRPMGPVMTQPLRSDLSAGDVQHMMEHRLAWQGNPNVKVGEVTEKDEDTIVAEIVTQDGSLVQKIEIDRHTGWMRPAQSGE
jgi:hypothetical protein